MKPRNATASGISWPAARLAPMTSRQAASASARRPALAMSCTSFSRRSKSATPRPPFRRAFGSGMVDEWRLVRETAMSEDAAIITETLERVAERVGDPIPLVFERLFAEMPEAEALFIRDKG